MSLVYREDFVREALRMRAEGKLIREIAEHFGVAKQTVSTWVRDPDLSKQRARRKRYQGVCEDCGAATDGSNGRANAPRYCIDCFKKRNAAPHGGRWKYNTGCRCELCTEAHRLYMRSLKGQEPPHHGTNSGYTNYGCRCDACSEARWKYASARPEYGRRWYAKVRGTEPPRHGYSTAYKKYACRCDECRAWAAAYYQQRKKRAAAA